MLKSYKDVLNELSKKYKKSSRWRTINSEIKSFHELTLEGDEEVNDNEMDMKLSKQKRWLTWKIN